MVSLHDIHAAAEEASKDREINARGLLITRLQKRIEKLEEVAWGGIRKNEEGRSRPCECDFCCAARKLIGKRRLAQLAKGGKA